MTILSFSKNSTTCEVTIVAYCFDLQYIFFNFLLFIYFCLYGLGRSHKTRSRALERLFSSCARLVVFLGMCACTASRGMSVRGARVFVSTIICLFLWSGDSPGSTQKMLHCPPSTQPKEWKNVSGCRGSTARMHINSSYLSVCKGSTKQVRLEQDLTLTTQRSQCLHRARFIVTVHARLRFLTFPFLISLT